MWLGLITSNGLGDDQEPKDLLGPFKTKARACKAVADGIKFVGQRGFIFEGEEVIPDIMPCHDCGGHGEILITESEGNEVHIKSHRPCETCDSTGKVPRKNINKKKK